MYVMQRGYTEGHNEDLCPRFHPSKFNMTPNTMDGTETRTCCDHEIWRLYAVFSHDWRVVTFPVGNDSSKSFKPFPDIVPIDRIGGCFRGFVVSSLTLPTCSGHHVGSSYAASVVSASSNGGVYGFETRSLLTSAWVLGFVLNISVTAAIATRLWWMGRTMASLTVISTRTNRFASSIYMIIESGAITLVCNTVLLALFTSSNPVLFAASDVFAQLTVRVIPSYTFLSLNYTHRSASFWQVLAPLLIIMQAVKSSRHPIPNVNSSTTILVVQRDPISRGGFSRGERVGECVVRCATFPLAELCARCSCSNDSGFAQHFYAQFPQHFLENIQSQDVPGTAEQGV